MSTFGAYRRNSRCAVADCLVTTMTASSASRTPTSASRTWPSASAWKMKLSWDGRSACGLIFQALADGHVRQRLEDEAVMGRTVRMRLCPRGRLGARERDDLQGLCEGGVRENMPLGPGARV